MISKREDPFNKECVMSWYNLFLEQAETEKNNN
jgi:hypothetical protein